MLGGLQSLNLIRKTHGIFSAFRLLAFDVIFNFNGVLKKCFTMHSPQSAIQAGFASRPYAFKKMVEKLNLSRDVLFFDIGFSEGETLFILNKLGFKNLAGIELVPRSNEFIKNNLNIKFSFGDAQEMTLDLVPTTFYCFHVASKQIERKIFQNIFSQLKLNFVEFKIIYHNNLYSTSEVESILGPCKQFCFRGNYFYLYESNH